MATFSLWDNLGHMKAFAYQSEHMEAIKNTAKKQWFKESLFARFYLQDSEGSWGAAANASD
jgi:heme-degrading monooxygenase HmoA